MIESFSRKSVTVLLAGCALALGGCGQQASEQPAAAKVAAEGAESARALAQKAAPAPADEGPSTETTVISVTPDDESAPEADAGTDNQDPGYSDSNDSGNQDANTPQASSADTPPPQDAPLA